MRKFNIMLFVLFVLLFAAGCSNNEDVTGNEQKQLPNQVKNEEITLGFCPTMADLAEELAENNNVKLKPFGYTAQALQELNNNQVDVVLVGRLAGENEVNEVYEKRLKDGLTLVGKEKKLIHISELKQSTIHTAVKKELAGKYVPIENIKFHNSTESAVNEGINDLVLINWTDYSSELGLVIPVDITGQKIEMFRIPVLYSYNNDYIENLDVS